MTLEEYLMDYASPATKAIGDKLIDKEVLNVPNEKARSVVLENLKLIRENNRRDFRPSSPSSSIPGVSIITTGPRGRSSIALSTGSVVVPLMSEAESA